jgi:hypothetical protein
MWFGLDEPSFLTAETNEGSLILASKKLLKWQF